MEKKKGYGLETRVTKIGFFIEEKIYHLGDYVENDWGCHSSYYKKNVLETKIYGPYPSEKIAKEELVKIESKRAKIFSSLTPQQKKLIKLPVVEYTIREERKGEEYICVHNECIKAERSAKE